MAATSWAVRPCLAWYAARAFLDPLLELGRVV